VGKTNRSNMEIGLYTFVDNTPDPVAGTRLSPVERMQNILEEMELADQVGLDVYAIGEHHRPEYLSSTPATILAAGAARTRRIRLSSAVTVLSSDDPVRVFQEFATLDLISNGRAEIMAGRGSFIESYPLFGYDLSNYDELFTEKLELLLKLRDSERVTWKGRHRPWFEDLGIYPRPVQESLPVWLAVGGTPKSVLRAGSMGLPLALAIIGGLPERFRSVATMFRESLVAAGHDPASVPMSINGHGFLADDSQKAADLAFPPFAQTMNRIGRERGWPPITRARFDAECAPRGAVFVGSPQQVIDKILWEHELFGHARTLIQFSVGTMPHREMLRAIELLGTVVAPAVRAALADQS
jgi:probable LLM family oxidoreductase